MRLNKFIDKNSLLFETHNLRQLQTQTQEMSSSEISFG